jgi:NOL1/NOP2/fmu family ribosome biogenesis protein
MHGLMILNSREKNRLLKQLCRPYGLNAGLFKELVLLDDGNLIWTTTRECLDEELNSFSIDSIGLPLARKKDLKPTVHAVQLFYQNASERTVELTRGEAAAFIRGEAVKTDSSLKGLVLVKHTGDAIDLGLMEEDLLERGGCTVLHRITEKTLHKPLIQ